MIVRGDCVCLCASRCVVVALVVLTSSSLLLGSSSVCWIGSRVEAGRVQERAPDVFDRRRSRVRSSWFCCLR